MGSEKQNSSEIKPKRKRGNPNGWKKGQSGNPKGRPKLGLTRAEVARAALEEVDPKTKRAKLLDLFRTHTQLGIEGKVDSAKLVLDSAYGMLTQKAEVAQTVTSTFTVEELNALIQRADATLTAPPEGWEDGLN